MIFSSVIFLFLFLPLALLVFYLTKFFAGRFTNVILLFCSLIFYSWGERKYTVILLCIIFLSYVSGRLIYAYRSSHTKARHLLFVLFLIFNILVLAVFKFQNFLPVDIHSIISINIFQIAPLHLPLGISFFMFRALSYLIDIYRGNAAPQKNIIDLALYMSFFPQLIAGPIIRYKHFYRQLRHRSINVKKTSKGIQRFILGLTKKLLLANTIGMTVNQIFSVQGSELNLLTAWFGIVCYSFQIYLDFSGYTDMAIGLADIFGFTFPENFNHPYMARSIREFWRRWHMTLTAFLRDYLYIPLGGNRLGNVRTYLNILIVFFVCGIWHGASLPFVVWGILHGVFLMLERTSFGVLLNRLPKALQHIYTLIVICIGWVFFRSGDLVQAGGFIHAMFSVSNIRFSLHPSIIVSNELFIILPIAIGLSCNIFHSILQWIKRKYIRTLRFSPVAFEYAQIVVLLLFFIIDLSAIAGETHDPFIYFRF